MWRALSPTGPCCHSWRFICPGGAEVRVARRSGWRGGPGGAEVRGAGAPRRPGLAARAAQRELTSSRARSRSRRKTSTSWSALTDARTPCATSTSRSIWASSAVGAVVTGTSRP